jgi:putative DNA primase/helicase
VDAHNAGINVVPIAPDGTKRPAVPWKEYQSRRVPLRQLREWFEPNRLFGIGVVTGEISGYLELIDFDTREMFSKWYQLLVLQGLGALVERVVAGYYEETPNGVHVFVRSSMSEGNRKLASRQIGPEEQKSLIETRGQGGIAVIAPSCGSVHPSGRPYVLLSGSLLSIQVVTASERQKLLDAACTLDELPKEEEEVRHFAPKAKVIPRSIDDGLLPGQIFNERASWENILLPHGWTLKRYDQHGKGEWLRPGKKGRGLSATTNWGGHNFLYVFSTSTNFEARVPYSPFAAYTLVNWNGDFKASCRALARLGYVDPLQNKAK